MYRLRILLLTLAILLLAGLPQAAAAGPLLGITAAAASPLLQVTAPTDGAMLPGNSVTVRFTTANIKLVPSTVPLAEAGKHPEANRPGEGHLHFMLDLQPLVVWEKSDPYTFADVPPGEHQLMVELVNNDHSSLSPQVVQMVRFSTTGIASGPQLQLTAPADGAVVPGMDVQIRFTTANIKLVPSTVPLAEAGKHPEANRPGEGHLHLMLDLQPLVVWEKGDPYTFSNVPPGEHQLMVELVNNDHSSLSPQVVQQIHFRTTGPDVLAKTGTPRSMYIAIGLFVCAAGLLLIAGWGLQRAGRRAARKA